MDVSLFACMLRRPGMVHIEVVFLISVFTFLSTKPAIRIQTGVCMNSLLGTGQVISLLMQDDLMKYIQGWKSLFYNKTDYALVFSSSCCSCNLKRLYSS